MNKKIVVAVGISAVILLIISIWIGMLYARPSAPTNDITPSPASEFEADAEAAISDTVAQQQNGQYKIVLSGTKLKLYEEKELLNETEIAPDVLPRADIKALSSGIEYFTIEEALLDWESLCK